MSQTKQQTTYQSELERAETKCQIYKAAAKRYKKYDLYAFVTPLMLLQIANTVIPLVISSVETEPADLDADKLDPSNALICVILAAFSGTYIGLSQKLRWGEKSVKYSNMANTYILLITQIQHEISQMAVKSSSQQEMVGFLRKQAAIETNARKNCPLAPADIVDFYTNKNYE